MQGRYPGLYSKISEEEQGMELLGYKPMAIMTEGWVISSL